jgi:lysozyme
VTIERFDKLARVVGAAEADGGPRLKAYQDSKGIWTIGYGTNLQELEIDKATAERWLHEKLHQAQHECRLRFPWFAELTPARQDAMTELVYNLGIPRLLGFKKALAAMAAGDYVTARAEFLDSNWRRDVKDRRAFRIADAILNG